MSHQSTYDEKREEEIRRTACRGECTIGEAISSLCLLGYETKHAKGKVSQWLEEYKQERMR